MSGPPVDGFALHEHLRLRRELPNRKHRRHDPVRPRIGDRQPDDAGRREAAVRVALQEPDDPVGVDPRTLGAADRDGVG